MEKDKSIEEAEKTLQVLVGINRTELNPYLFSKIINKMKEAEPAGKKFNFKLAITVVVVCLFTNLAVLLSYQDENNSGNYSNNVSDSLRTAQIESFASEYSSINSFYFY
jgi:hypothetical protein